ncbi:hypothetical protein CLV53_106166 [Sediminibacterium magnilacihabitans]|jgi:hypothetical protein|nr:hypothetical protein CLV53_106166 [Sediminibacterium magnilacihabitans]
MKRFTLLFALLLVFPFLSQAQIIRDTCPCLHQDSTIKSTILHNGKYSSVVYSMNNEVLSNKGRHFHKAIKTYNNRSAAL